MQQINVGGRTIIYTGTLIIRDGERASLSIPLQPTAQIGGENLNVELEFGDQYEQDSKVTWGTVDGVVKFLLTGWKYGAGAVLDRPLKFGSIYFAGQEHWLWFDMAHYRIRESNITHIVLSRGQPDGK